MSAPTDVSGTVIRSSGGTFHAPRASGIPHQGIDLMLQDQERLCLATTAEKPVETMSVRSIAAGRVAYARLNQATQCPKKRPNCDLISTGLGYTVIVDHGNGIYSLYSHLSGSAPHTKQCLPPARTAAGALMPVKVGDLVAPGDVIGYLGALGPNLSEIDKPSGNALATSEPVQVHFELFRAEPGLASKDLISKIVEPAQRGMVDPNLFLSQFGYR